MFNEKQLQILNSELDSSRVKTREKGNIQLSYLEGFDIIETANTVFGFGNWSYGIENLEHISTEQNQNQNSVVAYKAIVKVLVYDKEHIQNISRSDVGTGTGISKSSLADAHEGAAKEAVTDALKRCFRSFGNQFGNSLYDKSRNQNTPTHTSHQNQNYTNPQNQQHYQNANNQQTQRASSQSFDRYEFQSLYNLGLDVVNQNNGYLVVTGENQYAYRDAIKACSFKFDPKTKTWWKEQGAA